MDLRSKFSWLPGAVLEIGMYEEAAKIGKSLGEWFESLKAEKEGFSPYHGLTQIEMIKAKQAAKKQGKMPLPTAFDEVLGHFRVNISGGGSDTIGKMFQYSDSAVMMGEYISQVVAASLIQASPVSEIVSVMERTNAPDFRRIFMEDKGDDLELAELSKDEELPDIWIRMGDTSMRIHKYGRYIRSNFDDVDNVTFQAFNVVLSRIGLQMGVAEMCEAVRIGVLGDGNNNAAEVINPTTTATLNAAEVINLSSCLETPYIPTHLIAKKTQLNQYKAAVVGINNPLTTLGAVNIDLPKPIDWNKATAKTGLQDDYLFAMDARYCLGGVSTQAVFVESERLVKKQIKGTGIWYRSAFYKLDNDACKVMDVTYSGQ